MLHLELQLHNDEKENTLCAKIKDIDCDYQAEQWVQDTHNSPNAADVIKWVLYDELGTRCTWERSKGSRLMPSITQRSSRFAGKWEKGSTEIAI